jgi:hypothetical protein
MKSGFFIASLTFLIALAAPVYAFEWYPEFQSLTEEEQASFEGPGRLGSEYQSDILSYMKPLQWEYLWLTTPHALDLSLGSISARHFMVDGRLKLRKELTDFLEFRFTYFDERNRDRESVHHIFEFVAKPTKKVGISAYAEPSLYKRQNDVGLALLFFPTPNHEIRLFNTWVDLTRRKRNDRTDRFEEDGQPSARGLVGRLWASKDSGKHDFLEYAFRHETRTRWIFPDNNYEYNYEKLFASLFFNHSINRDLDFTLRVQSDRKFEARHPGVSWRTDRAFVIAQTVIHDFLSKPNWELTPGIEYAHRSWHTDGGTFRYGDLLPHVWLKMNHVKLGYELTSHEAKGNWENVFRGTELRDPEDLDGKVHQRLNTGYEFSFKDETAALFLMVTWDLDQLNRRIWQGGNVQFRTTF